LSKAGAFHLDAPASVLALWRLPAQLAGSATWRDPQIALIDIAALGEVGMVPGRRDSNGRPFRLPCGPVTAPREGGAIHWRGELPGSENT
jgi:hypothetical protein